METEFCTAVTGGGRGGRMPPAPRLALSSCSVDAAMLSRVRAGRLRGRVHSVFRRAVNLVTDDGELFTLAARGLGNAPQTALLPVHDLRSTGMALGNAVHARAGQLWIGDRLGVTFDTASVWTCVLPRWRATPPRVSANLAWLQGALRQRRLAQRPALGAFDRAALDVLEERAASLRISLREHEGALATAQARSLLGLGPGLTPAGDDFLVGLFAVLHLPDSPCERWLQGGAHVLQDAERATNEISLAALRSAGCGRVRDSIAVLLRELLRGGGTPLQAALARVLAIGASSGCDIAAGLACGLEIQLFHGSEPS
jgi:hypothetical protein